MKFIFLFLISFLLQNILTKENTSSTSTKYINKTDKPKEEKNTEEEINEDKGIFSANKIHELNDITFDYTIKAGKIYRWFILFYSRTCGHCKRAKKEISKIFDNYKNITNLRFAQMEAYQNTMTNIRFNITGVPYMILVENKKMYEMDLFPNYDNLKDFIFTNFSEVKEDLKPLPKKVKFAYVAWLILKQTLDDITNNINHFMKNKGIKFQFNTWGFVLFIISFIILTCWGVIRMCLKFCCNDDDILLELQRMEEEFKNKKHNENEQNEQINENKEIEEEDEEGAEYEIEEEEEDDEEVERVQENEEKEEKEGKEEIKKEKTEEEKKKEIEEQKEREQKEKEEKERIEKEKKEKEEKEKIEKEKQQKEKEKEDNKKRKNKKKKKD